MANAMCGCHMKVMDMGHIGLCGLAGIENIVSDDKHISGRAGNGRGRPHIEIVRELLSSQYPKLENPTKAYKTISGGCPSTTRL
jgi:hypothetical protein